MFRRKLISYQTELIFLIGKSKLIRIVNFFNFKTRTKVEWDYYKLQKSTINKFVKINPFFYQMLISKRIFFEIINKCNIKCILIKKKNIKYIVIDYKITDIEYTGFKIIVKIVGFAIYKSYYVSIERNKTTYVFVLFKSDVDEYV